MPFPFTVVDGFLGIKKSIQAGIEQSIKTRIEQNEAYEINASAEEMIYYAKRGLRISREKCYAAIEELGNEKIWALNNSMETFVRLFGQLHNFKLEESCRLDEFAEFQIDRELCVELKKTSAMASSVASSIIREAASGATVGALTAVGVYNTAKIFSSCSATKKPVSELTGIAAQNATLAFLGGGPLSVGGLSMAGGTIILGGLVAGSALAAISFVIYARANANTSVSASISKEEAYSNLAKARKFKEEAKTIEIACKAIRRRADMFAILLLKLEAIFEPLTESFAQVIQTNGTDFSKYGPKERAIVAANLSIAQAMKAVLDTPILTESGKLTKESETVAIPIRALIDSYAKS